MLHDIWRRHCFAPVRHSAVIVLALLLSACGSETSVGTSTPQSTATPSTPATVVSHGPTATALPPGVAALQGTLSENYATVSCPAGKPSGTICVSASGTGPLSSLGNVAIMRTASLDPGGADSCGPSTMTGTLTVDGGDTLSFAATGTFCRGTASARYTYTITGGTGAYRSASGKGNITIPRPPSSSTDILTWDGTLVK